jgi:hypothetical protein
MSKSMTAVLLSALVLPGAGHLYLKHFPRGLALIAISLACLWVFVDKAMQQASTVLEKLESEGGALDAGHIPEWRSLGFHVSLFFLALDTPEIAIVARVATRVAQGGHHVPEGLVRRIDTYTKAHHLTRSGFLAKAAVSVP